MKSEITPEIKASEIMMQAQTDRRFVLLLEGISDFKLFNRFTSEKLWEIEYLDGKENVAKFIEILESNGMSHYFSILDNDPFDHLPVEGNVVYTENSDLEADILANDKFLETVIATSSTCRPDRVLSSLGASTWSEVVHRIIGPWTLLRYISFQRNLNVPMSDFPSNIIDSSSATCVTDLAADIFSNRSKKMVSPEEAKSLLKKIDIDAMSSFHRGHHLTSVMAITMSTFLGSPKFGASGIEEKIRSVATYVDLLNLRCIQELVSWAHERHKCIWKTGLCSCQTNNAAVSMP